MSLDVEYTQAEVSSVNVRDFIDSKFLGLLLKTFPEAQIQSINIATGDGDGVVMYHSSKKSVEEGRLIVNTVKPESFTELITVIKDFKSQNIER